MDTTLATTLQSYRDACKSMGAKPSYLMITVLQKHINISKDEKNQQENGRLYLAGNNTLLIKGDIKVTPRLDDLDAALMFQTFNKNSLITSLDLRYNKITDDGAKYIGMLLMYNKCLKYLRLNGNSIGDIGGMYFAECLQINNTLERLDLSHTDLGTESVIAIATALKQNHILKSIDISRPILHSCQDELSVHFSRVFSINRGLTEVHLRKHTIHDHGLRIMCSSLVNNLHVTYLDLSCNQITRDSMDMLAYVLAQNTPLAKVDLSFNRIGDEGIIKIANSIEVLNTNLECLNVANNNINGKGLCALADAMSLNSTLSKVYIWMNNFEESACLAFSRLIECGRLKSKNTDVQSFVVDGITNLAELSHGTEQKWNYWAPSYGPQADPFLLKFIPPVNKIVKIA